MNLRHSGVTVEAGSSVVGDRVVVSLVADQDSAERVAGLGIEGGGEARRSPSSSRNSNIDPPVCGTAANEVSPQEGRRLAIA
jgi:hypothetical protein